MTYLPQSSGAEHLHCISAVLFFDWLICVEKHDGTLRYVYWLRPVALLHLGEHLLFRQPRFRVGFRVRARSPSMSTQGEHSQSAGTLWVVCKWESGLVQSIDGRNAAASTLWWSSPGAERVRCPKNLNLQDNPFGNWFIPQRGEYAQNFEHPLNCTYRYTILRWWRPAIARGRYSQGPL